jgi:methionyl-tRNA synthetase
VREEFESDAYCKTCGRETPHVYVTGTHERDSFNDSRTCKVCDNTVMGFSSEF